jgi:hypothetical protein
VVHHDRDAILSTDLSARDDFVVPQDVAFLNAANIGPRLAAVRAAETVALNRWSAPIGVQQATPSQLDRLLRDVAPEELIRRPAPEKWQSPRS